MILIYVKPRLSLYRDTLTKSQGTHIYTNTHTKGNTLRSLDPLYDASHPEYNVLTPIHTTVYRNRYTDRSQQMSMFHAKPISILLKVLPSTIQNIINSG